MAPILDLNTLYEQQREQKLTPQLLQFLWKITKIMSETTSYKLNSMFNRMKLRSHTLFFKTENAELQWKQLPVEGQRKYGFKENIDGKMNEV